MPDLELITVTGASLLAGFVNAIAGGGGLVSLPILFTAFPGAPPATLFGTNKASMVCGTAWAAANYARHVTLPRHTLVPASLAALAGGAAGAWLVTLVSPGWIRLLLPWMLAAVLAHTVLARDLGATHAPRLRPRVEAALGSFIGLALGLYDGFFGPGTGSFLIFLFIRLAGYDFLHAVATAKVLNTATNLGALATFGVSDNIWWRFFLPMAAANVAGSFLGTRLALRHGSRLIRVVFTVVVGALVAKTAYDSLFTPPAPVTSSPLPAPR
ncbi:MAG: sulfite exporter TauE/SafE family protein [Pirellulales bacterium]